MSRSTKIAVLSFAVAGMLAAPGAARAQTQSIEASGRRLSLDEARRLTWRRETRADGVAALRRLASEDSAATRARFELGRVLTWDVTTRSEGTALLRRVTEEDPSWAEPEEALAEVLAWDSASRAEAVTRLRRLLEREPARMSARLKLAEVLSWNSATRPESESLYRAVLEEDASSVEAAVGLARVLSWRGQFSESRVFYQLALAQDPAGSAAKIGLAQLDGWSGRARASLATLAAFPDETIETPEAFQLRAEAYSQIGRPARALEEYDALLALDPGNSAALQAAGVIRRRLRPVLEIGADGSRESGDAATSRVGVTSVPLRFSFHPGQRDVEVSLSASMASFRNSLGSSRDASFGAGVDVPIGNRVRISAEAATHDFEHAARGSTGRGQVLLTPHDRLDVRVGAARDQLFSSRLSLAGEQAADVFYGPSFVNEVFAGATVRPGRRWDLWAQATVGRIQGENIASNRREEVFAGAGRTFRPGAMTLRPGYSMAWMSYDLDLGGFPSIDDGGDGVTRRGVGGYFSPFRFLNQMARLDATVSVGDAVLMVAGAGVGQQHVEDVWSRNFARRTTSSDAYFGVRVSAGDRVSVRGQINYQDVASAFDRTVVRIIWAYTF